MNLALRPVQQPPQTPQTSRSAASTKPADLLNTNFDQSLAQADYRNTQQHAVDKTAARPPRASRTDRQNNTDDRSARDASSEKTRNSSSRRKADRNQPDQSTDTNRPDDQARSATSKHFQHTENSTNNIDSPPHDSTADSTADSDAQYPAANAESSQSNKESASTDDHSANFAGPIPEPNPGNTNSATPVDLQSSTFNILAFSDQSAQNIVALTAQNNPADASQNQNAPATDPTTTPSKSGENTDQLIKANQNQLLQNSAANPAALNTVTVAVNAQIQNQSSTNAAAKNARNQNTNNQNIAAKSTGRNTNEQAAGNSQSTAESQTQTKSAVAGLGPLEIEPAYTRKTDDQTNNNPDAKADQAVILTQLSDSQATELSHAQVGKEPQKTSILTDAKIQSAQQPPPPASDNQNNVERVARGLQTALSQRGGAVSLRLEPPELGVLKIQMEIQDGVISARFTTRNEAARNLLTHEMGQLRHALETRGLTIEGLDVHMQPTNQNATPTFQSHSQNNNAHDGRSRGQFTNQQNQPGQNNQPDDATKEPAMNFRDQLNMVA